jgi:hypothetical protein
LRQVLAHAVACARPRPPHRARRTSTANRSSGRFRSPHRGNAPRGLT